MKNKITCCYHHYVGYLSTLLISLLFVFFACGASSSVFAAEVEVVVYWPADANQNSITIETTSGSVVAGPFTSGGAATYNTTVGPVTLNDNQDYVVRMSDSANNGWGDEPLDGGGTARPSVTVVSDGVEVGNGTHLSGGNSSFTFPATSHTEAPTGTQSCTAFTGSWSGSGNVWSASTSGGMNATITLGASTGASWSGSTNNTLNTINTFSESSAQGKTSFSTVYYWDNSTTSSSDAAGENAANGTVRIDFTSGPILNPVIHFDRFGGYGGGAANSSEWLLTTSGASITRLAGASHFRTVGNRIFRDTTSSLTTTTSAESSLDPAAGTAAGSVMIEGIHSQLDFSLTGIGVEGAGADGIEIVLCGSLAPSIDFSDAPISGTAPNGTDSNAYGEASHTIVSGIYLGAGDPDSELSSQATATADGDDLSGSDDEDGVIIPPLTLGVASLIEVTAAGAGGKLQGWVDWNGDGDFNDLGEQLLTNVTDNGVGDLDLTIGKIAFTVTPALGGITGTTFARFRWSTDSGVSSTGLASDGEVEDYQITIVGASKLNGIVFEDINYGGGAGRDQASALGVGVNGVTVELYDNTGALIASTTTANDGTNDGAYEFTGLINGDYHVRVVSDTISSTRSGSDGSELAVQTFRTDGTTPVTAEVGGRQPTLSDGTAQDVASPSVLNTTSYAFTGGTLDGGQAQSVTPVTLAGADIIGINFGYN